MVRRDDLKAIAFDPLAGHRGNFWAHDFRVAKGTPMGKSFYLTSSYIKLRNASQVFSDLINAGAISYGLTMPQAVLIRRSTTATSRSFCSPMHRNADQGDDFGSQQRGDSAEGQRVDFGENRRSNHDRHGRAEGDARA